VFISASKFKARCLEILDHVHETGEQVTVTKRGRPLAIIRPIKECRPRYPQDELKGSVTVLGDIISPAVPLEYWEAESGPFEPPQDRRRRSASPRKRNRRR
jgi:prevent-host-death family protein